MGLQSLPPPHCLLLIKQSNQQQWEAGGCYLQQWDEDKAWQCISQLLASQLEVMLQFRNLMCFSKSMEVQCRKLPAVPSYGPPHSCLPNIYTIHSHRPESNLCPSLLHSFLHAPIASKMQGQLQTIKYHGISSFCQTCWNCDSLEWTPRQIWTNYHILSDSSKA